MKKRFKEYSEEELMMMSKEDMRKLNFGFSFRGFLFGVFYYFYKGLWLKAIYMSCFLWLAAVILDHFIGGDRLLYSGLGTTGSVFFALSANRDIALKLYFGETIWPSFPKLFAKKSSVAACLGLCVTMYFLLAFVFVSNAQLEYTSKKILNEAFADNPDIVCKGVNIYEEMNNDVYYANAVFRDGDEMEIKISYDRETQLVEISWSE